MKFLVPNMSDMPDVQDPHAELDKIAQNLGALYDQAVKMEDPNSLEAQVGVVTGEVVTLLACGEFIGCGALPIIASAIVEGAVIGAILAQADNNDPLKGALTGAAAAGAVHKISRLIRLKPRTTASARSAPASAAPATVAKQGPLTINSINIEQLCQAGKVMDRAGYTKAGRALTKHGYRNPTVFPKPTGTPQQINLHGQKVLEEILHHPDRNVVTYTSKKYGPVIEVQAPNIGGVRFSQDGKKMMGFLQPKKMQQ